MQIRRRTSYMSQKMNPTTDLDNALSTRTRKSISKSRRSSIITVEEKPPSRRTSLVAALSLLTIPSFMEEIPHSSQLVGTLEGHALYKVKVARSSKKLNYFFGETVPIDVCVNEIIKEGLKAMLESKVPLCYFLHHLLEEFSSENLFFFLDVSQFETQFKNLTDHREMAQTIFDKYISTTANFEVNLEDKVKRDIHTQFATTDNPITQFIFNEAKTSIYILLESSFIRFLHTQAYIDMTLNCGDLNIYYNDKITNLALNYLVKYLQSQQDTLVTYNESNHTFSDTLLSLNLQHYESVKLAIQGFIKTIFGIDYLSKKASWSPSNFEIINLEKNLRITK